MSKCCMADFLDAEVKAINIVIFCAKCLSQKFSELPKLFLIKFKTDSTFQTNKRRSFGGQLLKILVIKIQPSGYCLTGFPLI